MVDEKQASEAENGALMMWLTDKKNLQASIETGIEYFESKYGLKPNVCILNPADAIISETETIEMTSDLLVSTAQWCLKGHCLIGLVSSKDSVWGISF